MESVRSVTNRSFQMCILRRFNHPVHQNLKRERLGGKYNSEVGLWSCLNLDVPPFWGLMLGLFGRNKTSALPAFRPSFRGQQPLLLCPRDQGSEQLQAGLLMEDHSLSRRFVLLHYFYFCCKFYYYYYYLYYVTGIKLLRLAAMSCIKAATLSEWSLNGKTNNGNKKHFMVAKLREK